MELYVGDTRIVTLSLYSRSGASLTPDSATIEIKKGDSTIVEEAAAGVSGNTVYYTINDDNVTESSGEYKFIWRIVSGDEKFTIVDSNVTVMSP